MTQQLDILSLAGDAALRAENERLTALVADLRGQLAVRAFEASPPAPQPAPVTVDESDLMRKLREEVDEWSATAADKQVSIEARDREIKRLTDEVESLDETVNQLEDQVSIQKRKIDDLTGANSTAENFAGTMYYELTGEHFDWVKDHVKKQQWIDAATQALPS